MISLLATNVIPVATVRCAPNLAASFGVRVATSTMIGDIGRKRSEAPRALYPRISWKYWVMRNITPNIARKIRIIPALPALNAGLRNRVMSSIGSSTWSSHTTNAVRMTMAMANAPSVARC